MRRSSLKPVVLVVLVSFLFTAFAALPSTTAALTAEERESARNQCLAKYTAVGAVGGALLGGLLGRKGSKTEGVLIGAAAGGALSFAVAWGHCLSLYSNLDSQPMADERTTAGRVGYSSSRGYVVKIENFSINPEGISPGGKIQMNGSYYVMAPEGGREVKINETRVISYFDASEDGWKELGTVDKELTSYLGTRRIEGVFDMPADVPEGNYRITLRIKAMGREDSMTRDFKVRRGLAMGPESDRNLPAPYPPAGRNYEQTRPDERSYDKSNYYDRNYDRAVFIEVVSRTLNVRAEPSSRARLMTEISKGETYKVLKSIVDYDNDRWYKIRLDNGDEGWVPGKHVRTRDN